MLVYHPAFDPYHCAFRMLALLERAPGSEWEHEKIRLLDFFLVFPETLATFQFVKGKPSIKAYAASMRNPFNSPSQPRRLLFQMRPLQTAALDGLSRGGLLQSGLYAVGLIRRSQRPLPEGFISRLSNPQSVDHNVLAHVAGELGSMGLFGPQGLKARSSLLEHRYDAA
jgi:hypothetical protein